MREIYEKVYRKKDFTFNFEGNDYSTSVICVRFNYAYKDFNQFRKNTYVKAGFNGQELLFENNLAIVDGEIAGIVLNEPIEDDSKALKDISKANEYFDYEDGHYVCVKNFKNLKSCSELRDYLYHHGFNCDGTHYVRFKRSSGSSRVGKCLFIDEALYKRFWKWDLCGLQVLDGDEIDLAALEAYISLTSSSIIDTLCLEPKNFLVIDDYESVFVNKVVGVDYKNGNVTAEEGDYEIQNSIFDGQSLLDSSLFDNKYSKRGMLLLRNRFFKSACFNTNIQEWFKNNNISKISELNGRTIATKLEDIKIITTPSSIKYLKFGTLEQWFNNIEPTFGIVKHEKPTHYFQGRMVQCHYQLLNTLQLSNDDVATLLQPNLDYISLIRNDPDVLRYHIKYPFNESDAAIKSKDEIVFKLLGINYNFSKTKLYLNFRDALVKSMIRNLKQGHILINGNYSTLFGNGLEMLKHSIGKFDGTSIIGTDSIHTTRFKYGQYILGSRSPHINSGNVLIVKNEACSEIDKYFNLSDEIVYINSIDNNILQRLNGSDFDSDTLLLTNNQTLIQAAQKNYEAFKVPTCLIHPNKRKRYYTSSDKVDLDVKTSVNKIGEIVNLSQQLNSLMWDNINRKHQTIEENLNLYYDICKLAVLSGIEIDRAKKEYELSSQKLLKELKEKYKIEKNGRVVKPMFFKMITQENGFKLNSRHLYKYFETPMDYLQKQISAFNFRKGRDSKQDIWKFSDIVNLEALTVPTAGKYYEKRDRILALIMDLKNQINRLYFDYESKGADEKIFIRLRANELKQQAVEYINDISLNDTTMILLLRSIDSSKYASISKMVFEVLFGAPNKNFFKILKSGNHRIKTLAENEYGSIHIYDFNFIKISKNK